MTPEQIAELTGQSQGQAKSGFPRIIINKLGEDDSGNAIPIGFYQMSQDGRALFGKPILFRPFFNMYKYSVYDGTENKYTNQSILVKNFGEEAVDELGGVACGRVPRKKWEGLSAAEQAKQKAIKCYRVMYGVTTFDGVDNKGEKHSVDAVPALLRLSGDNFMPIQEVLDALNKAKVSMLNYNIELTTKRKKNGTNVYYQMVPSLVDQHVSMSKADWTILGEFKKAIEAENAAIIDRHHKAKGFAIQAEEDKGAIIELGADLNDDISDIGAE